MPPPGSYAKSTKSPTRSRNNKQKSRRSRAPTPKYGNNQRSNLPSEVSKPKAVVKPSVKADKAINTESKRLLKNSAALSTQINKKVQAKSAEPAVQAQVVNSPAVKGNTIERNRTYSAPKAKQPTPSATAIKPGTGVQAKAPVKQAKPLLSVEPTNLPARNYGAFDNSTYQANAKAGKDSVMPTVSDKYRNDDVSYNQAYWAAKKAGGASQADMKTQQDSIGIKKAYSGDKVITEDMKRKASDDLSRITGSMATLQNKGVTKTEEKSGLLGEKLDTTYNYKGGPSIVTRATDPTIKGLRLGAKTSTTFVNGVEVATKTGSDPLGKDAKVTRPEGLAKGINDRVEASPDPIKEISDIDNQIKTETDPGKLKALYKRRLMLMRMNQTNTKFAGLLGEADTKRTNLMSIA